MKKFIKTQSNDVWMYDVNKQRYVKPEIANFLLGDEDCIIESSDNITDLADAAVLKGEDYALVRTNVEADYRFITIKDHDVPCYLATFKPNGLIYFARKVNGEWEMI